MTDAEFRKLIERAHKALGTNREVARTLGVPLRTLEEWKSGRRRPCPYTIDAMAARLKLFIGKTAK